MMKNSLLLIFFVLATSITAQQKYSDTALLDKGNALYNLVEKDSPLCWKMHFLDTISKEQEAEWKALEQQRMEGLEQALSYFEQLIEHYPSSRLLHRARNNTALIYREIGQEEQAIYYKKNLNSKADDNEDGGVGIGIMAEPYALYKNRACKQLAEIFLQQKQYRRALQYMSKTRKYPYQHFCGNEYIAEAHYKNIFYVKCYTGLKQPKKALSYCLPYAINQFSEENNIFARLAATLLREQYDRTYLLEALEQAINTAYVEMKNGLEWYFIDYMGEQIEISFFTVKEEETLAEAVRAVVESTYFYELLKLEDKPFFRN
ncbi:MAG: tetratricopeptide repeat protein [Aureispira sp.]